MKTKLIVGLLALPLDELGSVCKIKIKDTEKGLQVSTVDGVGQCNAPSSVFISTTRPTFKDATDVRAN